MQRGAQEARASRIAFPSWSLGTSTLGFRHGLHLGRAVPGREQYGERPEQYEEYFLLHCFRTPCLTAWKGAWNAPYKLPKTSLLPRLVPKLELSAGSQAPAWEPVARSSCFAVRTISKERWKPELPRSRSQAGAWEQVRTRRPFPVRDRRREILPFKRPKISPPAVAGVEMTDDRFL